MPGQARLQLFGIWLFGFEPVAKGSVIRWATPFQFKLVSYLSGAIVWGRELGRERERNTSA